MYASAYLLCQLLVLTCLLFVSAVIDTFTLTLFLGRENLKSTDRPCRPRNADCRSLAPCWERGKERQSRIYALQGRFPVFNFMPIQTTVPGPSVWIMQVELFKTHNLSCIILFRRDLFHYYRNPVPAVLKSYFFTK